MTIFENESVKAALTINKNIKVQVAMKGKGKVPSYITSPHTYTTVLSFGLKI